MKVKIKNIQIDKEFVCKSKKGRPRKLKALQKDLNLTNIYFTFFFIIMYLLNDFVFFIKIKYYFLLFNFLIGLN